MKITDIEVIPFRVPRRPFRNGELGEETTIVQTLTRIKTDESDGYSALQVTTGSVKPQRISKSIAGQYAAVSTEPGEGLFEFRIDAEDLGEIEAGTELTVERFEAGQVVDVTGTSIGKGFAGTVKRHHFATQDNTHGNSLAHRAPGSIGQNQTPGRVFKGKKMAGHMGNVKRTAQGLEVVQIDAEHNLIAVKGAVPGSRGGRLIIKPTIKASAKSNK